MLNSELIDLRKRVQGIIDESVSDSSVQSAQIIMMMQNEGWHK